MSGIHHVTAIAGAPSRNLDFYTRVLGLRLVKKTVNFDDPGTYHLYYGDEQGQPGTILTFFPWEHAAPGRLGVGETQETAFRIPAASIGYWTHRLLEKGVTHGAPEKRFGETVLPFTDPDGMRFALVGVAGRRERAGLERRRYSGRACDPRLSRRDACWSMTAAPTAAILTDVLGFREAGARGCAARYRGDAPLGGACRSARGRRFPARAASAAARCITSRSAPRTMPRRPRWREKLVADHAHASDRAEGPQLFPLGLFPRAERHPVRDRDRSAGLRGRRAGGELGQSLKLPRFLEAAPRRA